MIAWIVAGVLFAYSVTISILYLSNRLSQSNIIKNQDTLKAWLKVHQDLQTGAGAVLEIRRINPNDMFVWGREK